MEVLPPRGRASTNQTFFAGEVVTPGRRREHAQHVSSLKIYFRSRLTAVVSRILKSLLKEGGNLLRPTEELEGEHFIIYLSGNRYPHSSRFRYSWFIHCILF